MTLAFGTYKESTAFRRELVFSESIELVVRNNSSVYIGPGVVATGSDLRFCASNPTVFHVSHMQLFRFDVPLTSTTKIRVDTFVPDDGIDELLVQELIDEGFVRTTINLYRYFLHPIERIRPKLQDIQSVALIGSIPYGLIQELHHCPNIKRLSLDLSVKYGDHISNVEIQEVIRGMPWLERICIHDKSYPSRAEPLDLSVGLSKIVELEGNLRIRGVEGWTHVEHLELRDFSIPAGLFTVRVSGMPSGFLGCLTSLRVLVLCRMDCSTLKDLSLSNASELRIEKPQNVDRAFCVSIGRLLRRNRLTKLAIRGPFEPKKHDFQYVLLPLLEGSNTSLEELDLVGTDMSTTCLMYFMEDMIKFCPTIRTIRGFDSSEWLQSLAERRNNYAAIQSSLRALLDAARPDSVVARSLEIVRSFTAVFSPTYRRRNRKWHRTGSKELVSTPLELL
jgi:hypothetical protein